MSELHYRRAPFVLIAIIILLLGGAAGLERVGIQMPLVTARLIAIHGPLLVLGFLGTVIALERAVSLNRPWALVSPALCASGALALVSPLPLWAGASLITAGMAALVLVFVGIAHRQWNTPVAILSVSSACGAIAAAYWTLDGTSEAVVAWLVAFIVLAILGERWELARLRTSTRRAIPFLVLIAVLVASVALVPLGVGGRLVGIALFASVLWLLFHDVARRTVRLPGIPRFSAVGVLCGYASLLLAAISITMSGTITQGMWADVAIHGVFVGFAMSMVMAHAPIILPAVLRTPVRFFPVSWAPLVTLQVSLALRYAGTAAASHPLLVAGGIGNAIALLGFVVITAGTVRLSLHVSGHPHKQRQRVKTDGG